MKNLLISLLAILLIIEEWLWDVLTAFGRLLSRLLNLERFENWLSQASPVVALGILMAPVLIVTPINLAAFILLANGMILQSLMLEVLAKLLGTLLIARIFALTKPQLLTFSFLKFIYTTITHWLHWAHRIIAETAVYRLAKQFQTGLKARFAVWFK